MMNTPIKKSVLSVLFLMMTLLPVTSLLALQSDEQIKEKVKVIVQSDNNFHVSLVVINVDNSKVTIQGSFLDFRDPSRLKHKVAEIEGVLAIKIAATFLVTPVQLNEVAHGNHSRQQINKSQTPDSAIRL